MLEFWESVIRPLFNIAKIRIVVEVGAAEGKNTTNLLTYCSGRKGYLHIIDPFPSFDVKRFQQRFAPVFTVYPDLSLNILPKLDQFDAVLIDGDHNWFTVFHELKIIEKGYGDRPSKFPLIFLHDIGWPYARRDLYHQPDTIPIEYRHAYARQGIVPGQSELMPAIGINRRMCNAIQEGGSKNGVLTAIEDFLSETMLSFMFIKLPVYFGLGIMVTCDRLQDQPALQRHLVNLSSSIYGLQKLFERLENNRIKEMISSQNNDWQVPVLPRSVSDDRKNSKPVIKKNKISVIVVIYNMRREAERALYSLSAQYQQGIESEDFEVIVVENGSTEPLIDTDMSRFGPNFIYHYLENASKSPACAINKGAELATGDILGIMIDGAHLLTPGVLKYVFASLLLFKNPVVAFNRCFLGPGQQPVTVLSDYNQEAEDKLLNLIDWPQDGYRLFEIGELMNLPENGWV